MQRSNIIKASRVLHLLWKFTEKLRLYFSYPCDKACFELAVKIDDIKLYYETKNKLWGFSGPVIIYAKWNHSNCTINNKKQIIPLK